MKVAFECFLFSLNILNTLSEHSGMCPKIVTKNDWGARAAATVDYSIIPLKYVIVHHTLTPSCKCESACADLLKNLQNFHMDIQGFHDIGYNFLVGGDGNVYEGAGWHRVGAHTKHYNTKAIGLAFVGNFTSKLPNKKQLHATGRFLKCAIERGEIDRRYKLLGARTVSATQSPGLALFREIQRWEHFSRVP
ncbi:PGRPS1 [Trypoxylus dichotomus]